MRTTMIIIIIKRQAHHKKESIHEINNKMEQTVIIQVWVMEIHHLKK